MLCKKAFLRWKIVGRDHLSSSSPAHRVGLSHLLQQLKVLLFIISVRLFSMLSRKLQYDTALLYAITSLTTSRKFARLGLGLYKSVFALCLTRHLKKMSDLQRIRALMGFAGFVCCRHESRQQLHGAQREQLLAEMFSFAVSMLSTNNPCLLSVVTRRSQLFGLFV